jgi:8-oxo-dGTP pyrophosphatase MutT (NUDIX family)
MTGDLTDLELVERGKCLRCRARCHGQVYELAASGPGLVRQEWFICGECYDELAEFMWVPAPDQLRRRRRAAARRAEARKRAGASSQTSLLKEGS